VSEADLRASAQQQPVRHFEDDAWNVCNNPDCLAAIAQSQSSL
jgi:hypothetical protein